jgi:hypothetical protein
MLLVVKEAGFEKGGTGKEEGGCGGWQQWSWQWKDRDARERDVQILNTSISTNAETKQLIVRFRSVRFPGMQHRAFSRFCLWRRRHLRRRRAILSTNSVSSGSAPVTSLPLPPLPLPLRLLSLPLLACLVGGGTLGSPLLFPLLSPRSISANVFGVMGLNTCLVGLGLTTSESEESVGLFRGGVRERCGRSSLVELAKSRFRRGVFGVSGSRGRRGRSVVPPEKKMRSCVRMVARPAGSCARVLRVGREEE